MKKQLCPNREWAARTTRCIVFTKPDLIKLFTTVADFERDEFKDVNF